METGIIDELFKVFATALVGVGVPALVALAFKALSYLGIKESEALRARLEAAGRAGALLAEEKGRQVVKAGLEKLKPEEKLAEAVAVVLDRVPGVTRAEAEEVVHQQLPAAREIVAGGIRSVLAVATSPEPTPAS